MTDWRLKGTPGCWSALRKEEIRVARGFPGLWLTRTWAGTKGVPQVLGGTLSHLRSTKKLKNSSSRSPRVRPGLRRRLHMGISRTLLEDTRVPTRAALSRAPKPWLCGAGCTRVTRATMRRPGRPPGAHWLRFGAPPPRLGLAQTRDTAAAGGKTRTRRAGQERGGEG